MALELNGTTGVSLVQDGVVTAADLASTLDLTGKSITGSGITTYTTKVDIDGSSATDITGIPSWVNKISLRTTNVSVDTNTNTVAVRLGTSSGFLTSGYTSVATYISTATGPVTNTSTTSFNFIGWGGPDNFYFHSYDFYRSIGTNIWVLNGAMHNEASSGYINFIQGRIELADTLTQLRIFTSDGAYFDAGSLRISYE